MKRNPDGTWPIETAEQAACFPKDVLGGFIEHDGGLVDFIIETGTLHYWPGEVTDAQLLEAIKPRDGRQVRVIEDDMANDECPKIWSPVAYKWYSHFGMHKDTLFLDDNALTRGTCGEIREMIKFAKGE
jgi:hypothetical protein